MMYHLFDPMELLLECCSNLRYIAQNFDYHTYLIESKVWARKAPGVILEQAEQYLTADINTMMELQKYKTVFVENIAVVFNNLKISKHNPPIGVNVTAFYHDYQYTDNIILIAISLPVSKSTGKGDKRFVKIITFQPSPLAKTIGYSEHYGE